jgi:hypothetical protein
MALTTYAELKTALSTWTRRADMATYADDLITVAEGRIFKEVRCREMEAALSVLMVSGVAAVPTDYSDLKFAYIDGTPIRNLQRKDPSWIHLQYPYRSSEGKPDFIARDVDSFIFGPYPDSAYTVKGTYYKKLTAVSATVNSLYTNQPDLYVAASLAEAFRFLRNDNMQKYWEGRYTEIKNSINAQDKAERISGGPLQMVVA